VTWRDGVGPVALGARHIVDDSDGLFLGGIGFEDDDAAGVEELVGDVGQDGGAAGGDAAFGDEDQEAVEKLVDVRGGIELREFGEEFRGEVFRVALGVRREGAGDAGLGVAEAKAKMSFQAGKPTALAIGIAIGTARSIRVRRACDGIRRGAWANRCGVHWFILLWAGGGYTPHPMHECQNKGDRKWAICKCMKTKRGD